MTREALLKIAPQSQRRQITPGEFARFVHCFRPDWRHNELLKFMFENPVFHHTADGQLLDLDQPI